MLLCISLTLLFFLAELVYFQIAKRYKITDVPNHRSAHQNVTIRGIGIVFLLAIICYAFLSNFQYPYFIVGVLLIGSVSFVDDVKPLPNRYRLIVQVLSVGLLLVEVLQQYTITPFILLPLLLVVGVGIINAYNFMDGINGITGAYSLLAIVTLYFINKHFIVFIDEQLLLSIGLSIGVFLFFNFRKVAVGFCGDVGSVSMAFIVLFCVAMLIFKTSNFKYIFLLTLYGIDTIYTIIYRLLKGEDIFKAHKSHFFQVLLHEYKWTHLQISSVFVAVQLIINVAVVHFEMTDIMFYIPLILTLATIHYYRTYKKVGILLGYAKK